MKKKKSKLPVAKKRPETFEEYNAKKQKEVFKRVGAELKAHDGKNFLERYALYMLRVQMYELSLKQDLQQLFGVSEEKAERMNLSSIFRHYVKNDIRAHPILYVNVVDIAEQRNAMAHEFLAISGSLGGLAGESGVHLSSRTMDKWVFELELAFQQYLMLKETKILYTDCGLKPQYPGDDGNPYVRCKKKP
jgi:hypothetical protein